MPRNSRHKSSKHSSRDTKDYSDSERDSGVKDRKDSTRESSVRASKELASGEKRKLDSKENKESLGSANGIYSEEYTSSKRLKERVGDRSNDRWNGGPQDDHREKKSKVTIESRNSKRRDGSVVVYGDGEESGKKNGGNTEGKHREPSRKDGEKEKDRDRDRKGKEGKSEGVVNGEDRHDVTKQVTEKTGSFGQDLLQSPEMENQFERRIKRKRGGSGEGDKHQDEVGDVNSRRQSYRDDITKDGRLKNEKRKDERYREKLQEEMNKVNGQQDEKQRDENITRDCVHSRTDEKYLRDGNDTAEVRQKKTDRDGECDHNHNDLGWDYDLDHNSHHERERDEDHDRRHGHNRNRFHSHDHVCDREHDHDSDWDWERDRDVGQDGSNLDDQSARYKDSRRKKTTPDDYNDNKPRVLRAMYYDVEKRSLSSGRVEQDADWGRSQPHQGRQETTVGGSRRRSSPSSSSHGVSDEYRNFKYEDLKYRDGGELRSRPNSSQDATGFSGSSERASKYRYSEIPVKPDDGYMGELSTERPSSSKASPIGLVDRSPSSTSLELKYISKTGTRRSLDIEESGWRSRPSIGARDSSVAEDRFGGDFPPADGSPQTDSSFYSRTSQGFSSSFVTPQTSFRGGVGSPSFLGSYEEDTRVGNGTRYRRSSDPNLVRLPGNAWRGPPNWSSQVPNGFIPFQYGPPHGGFRTMMPQFSSSPMFGVRPPMDINPSGIPYPFPDAERFSGQLHSLGWPNMMDGSVPPHLHGWDGSNGVYRDEPHMYVGPDWDHSRHHVNDQGWESRGDAWKGQNSDVIMDLLPMSHKEDLPMQSVPDDVHTGMAGQKSQYGDNSGTGRCTEAASIITSSEEMPKSSPKITHEKSSDPTKTSNEDGDAQFFRAYLSKLDISTELTDPDLYGLRMTQLNIEQNGTADRVTNMLVSLKDGRRAISKGSASFLASKFLPVADDSLFQRAMDLYKKQRVNLRALENVCCGASDIISAFDVEKMEEAGNACNVERVEEPNSISDIAMQNAPDQEEAKPFADSVPDDTIYRSAIPDVSNQEKAEAVSADEDSEMMSKGEASGAALCCPLPLILTGGSPNASGALLPGSNESVILSRIHHSPKSTH